MQGDHASKGKGKGKVEKGNGTRLWNGGIRCGDLQQRKIPIRIKICILICNNSPGVTVFTLNAE